MKSKDQKRKEAIERNSRKRSPVEQRDALDEKLGKGVGAMRERKRLDSQIQK